MAATIVNPRHDRGPAVGITPPGYGYVLFGAEIAAPSGPPFVRSNRTRQRILEQLSRHLDELRRLDGVERATGYRALLMPPARPPTWRPSLQPPRFDVAALIETSSPDALAALVDAPKIASLRDLLHDEASQTMEMRAGCIRAIADVDKRLDGIYLFNFWAAQDVATALEVWDHLAPWFQSKTGLGNSTVLQPTDKSDFAFVNHARWDRGMLHIAANQFLRPSFYTFVRRNLDANHVHVYPALYRRI